MQRLASLAQVLPHPTMSSDIPLVWTMATASPFDFESAGSLKGKTIVISGASRGIGLAIALRCAQDGANVAILAKTTTPHPKLPGTIYTAAEEIKQKGGKALPLACDIRSEEQVKASVQKVVETFGGIDIVINNASAIALLSTEDLPMKRYDLIHQINIRGTFLLTKTCLPHLKKASNPQVLTISPPLNMEQKWFKDHPAYSIGKYGMSMLSFGWAKEFQQWGIACNCLWPRTAIATMAVQNEIGGEVMMKMSRKPEIMADAAYVVLSSKSSSTNGQFFIDDFVLRSQGQQSLSHYQCDPTVPEHELVFDFFC